MMRFAIKIANSIEPITIELTNHVDPKVRDRVVTALVSINRKAAPKKNRCQLISFRFKFDTLRGINERARIRKSGMI